MLWSMGKTFLIFFAQQVKNNLRTNEKSQTIVTGQGDDYTTGCLLDYPYFKENYKLIAIDSSKQLALDANPKTIQQINFTGNLARNPIANAVMFFLIKETKESILDFSLGNVKVFWIYFTLIFYFQYKMIQCNTLNLKLYNL